MEVETEANVMNLLRLMLNKLGESIEVDKKINFSVIAVKVG